MSKNNLQERVRKMEQHDNHFSIRKLTVGVASVLIGTTFYLNSNNQVVHADTLSDQTTQVAQQTTVDNDASINSTSQNVTPVEKTQIPAQQSTQVNQNPEQKQSVQNANVQQEKSTEQDTNKSTKQSATLNLNSKMQAAPSVASLAESKVATTQDQSNPLDAITVSDVNITTEQGNYLLKDSYSKDDKNIYKEKPQNDDSYKENDEKKVSYTSRATIKAKFSIDTSSEEFKGLYSDGRSIDIEVSLPGLNTISNDVTKTIYDSQSNKIGTVGNSHIYLNGDNFQKLVDQKKIINFETQFSYKLRPFYTVDNSKTVYYSGPRIDLGSENYSGDVQVDVTTKKESIDNIELSTHTNSNNNRVDYVKDAKVENPATVNTLVETLAKRYEPINELPNLNTYSEENQMQDTVNISADSTSIKLSSLYSYLKFPTITYTLRQAKDAPFKLDKYLNKDYLTKQLFQYKDEYSLSSKAAKTTLSLTGEEVDGLFMDYKYDNNDKGISADDQKKVIDHLHVNVSQDDNYTYYEISYDGPTIYAQTHLYLHTINITDAATMNPLNDKYIEYLKNHNININDREKLENATKDFVNSQLQIEEKSDNSYELLKNTPLIEQPKPIYTSEIGKPATGQIRIIDNSDHNKIYGSVTGFSGKVGDSIDLTQDQINKINQIISSNGVKLIQNEIIPGKFTFTDVNTTVDLYVDAQKTSQQYQFVDKETNQNIGSPVTVNGLIGKTSPVQLTIPANYELAPGETLPTETGVLKETNPLIKIYLVAKHEAITDPAQLNKTVKRTVNYVDPATKQTKQVTVQNVKFTRTGDKNLVTGKVTFTDWTPANNKFAKVTAPSIKGYKVVNPNAADEMTVTPASSDTTVTFTYNKLDPIGVKPDNDHPATKNVTRIIKFEGIKRDPITQQVSFSRLDKDGFIGYKDPVTDVITYNKWMPETRSWTEYTPTIVKEGNITYTPVTKKVESKVVTAATPDETVIVKYKAEAVGDPLVIKANPKYTDPVGLKPDNDHPATKTVTRTIKFTGITRDPITQTVTFSRVDKNGYIGYFDPVTEKITYNKWTPAEGTWNSYIPEVVEVDGVSYYPDVDKVDSKVVTIDSKDEVVVINYVPQIIDEPEQPVKDPELEPQPQPTPDPQPEPEVKEVTPEPTKVEKKTPITHKVEVKAKGTETVKPKAQPQKELPQTGVKDQSLEMIAGAIAADLLGLWTIGEIKRKKRED